MDELTEKLLLEAKRTYDPSRLINDLDYSNLNMYQFILKAVLSDSQYYGKTLQKKIIFDLCRDTIDTIRSVPDKEDCGDMCLTNQINSHGEYYEIKCSVLSSTDTWAITNIRPWQDYKFFILLFIDRSKDFKYRFFVIDKQTLLNSGGSIGLHFQNNTAESNVGNDRAGRRATISRGKGSETYLLKHNLLEDNSYESLCKFMFERHEVLGSNDSEYVPPKRVIHVGDQLDLF